MINIKDYSVCQLQDYFKSIKEDGINPNPQLFQEIPDYDLKVENFKLGYKNEDDVKKLLLWIICKSNIKEIA